MSETVWVIHRPGLTVVCKDGEQPAVQYDATKVELVRDELGRWRIAIHSSGALLLRDPRTVLRVDVWPFVGVGPTWCGHCDQPLLGSSDPDYVATFPAVGEASTR